MDKSLLFQSTALAALASRTRLSCNSAICFAWSRAMFRAILRALLVARPSDEKLLLPPRHEPFPPPVFLRFLLFCFFAIGFPRSRSDSMLIFSEPSNFDSESPIPLNAGNRKCLQASSSSHRVVGEYFFPFIRWRKTAIASWLTCYRLV